VDAELAVVRRSWSCACECSSIAEADGPIELLEPGRHRDDVRLLVTSSDGEIAGNSFLDLPDLLAPGDVVVVNNSATIPAALPADLHGEQLLLHVSSAVPDSKRRFVELRRPDGLGSVPFGTASAGDVVRLPARASARLVAPRLRSGKPPRLWEAELLAPVELTSYLRAHGAPIRYGHVSRAWDLEAYQTIFARIPGSSEMPSAGRPFSGRVVRRLRARGVTIAAVTLHAGVASLELDELPAPEPFRVPASTATLVNTALATGRRVIAVGTTVVRALESVTDPAGRVDAGEGFTDLVVDPDRAVRSVTALLTGFHEPEASHIKLLEAIAGADSVERSYAAARRGRYRWHEFGDVHLLMRRNA
jgi:S-adenosylmethionine:tRNA ribosyltransferase-isomerase